MLVPGLMCDRAVWEQAIEPLAGLAASEVIDHGTLDSIAGMAQAVLERAPQRFALAGHSMGGRVALEVYRAAPERVQALALLDTGYQAWPGGAAGEAERAGRHELLEVARRHGTRAMGERWVQGMVHPGRLGDRALIDAILAMIERHPVPVFEAQIRALLARPDATGLLPRIACPTLVLVGREDAWSPLARHEAMAAAIPGATLAVIERCGHMSTMERPDEVGRALRRWLTGSLAGPGRSAATGS
jgi:pimeloyl-ACP methyl ester carboxylesterase